ncbi:MAG: HAD hydrolase family protein [Candidatus Euphemobacter frigidus]|nr:HAD hydrolase family protein [Candidatus Euphemobacter frigidus]MDP8275187.1 HAD hydrolase family protein [Candidatus Euphemobacter frigidus]
MNQDLNNRAAGIRLIIIDVDGVLTDGKIYLDHQGEELKSFHIRDGSALIRARKEGVKVALVSGRKSDSVVRRARELGITDCYQGLADKALVVEDLMARYSCGKEGTAYLGDDIPDLPAMRKVGFSIAVADAHPDVLAAADYRTGNRGGSGAVMETIELILRARKR